MLGPTTGEGVAMYTRAAKYAKEPICICVAGTVIRYPLIPAVVEMTASVKPIRPVREACASVCVRASKLWGASRQFSPHYRLTDFPAPRAPHFTCAQIYNPSQN